MCDEERAHLSRILAFFDYWGLFDPHKAAKLVKDKQASYRKAAKVCGVSVGAIQRAVRALKNNREIRVVGRPKLLSKEQSDELARLVTEADEKQTPLDYRQFQQAVCFSSTPFTCLSGSASVYI